MDRALGAASVVELAPPVCLGSMASPLEPQVEDSSVQCQARAHPPLLPQSAPNTLMFQNTSSRLSIPLSILRLREEASSATDCDTEDTEASATRLKPTCSDDLEAYCLELELSDQCTSSSKQVSRGVDRQDTLQQKSGGEATLKVSAPAHYDALLHVLRLLSIEFRIAVVPLVCKEWRDAAFDPACWSHVEVGEVRFREGLADAAREIFWDASPRQLQGLIKKALEKSAGQMQLFRALVPTADTLYCLAESCPNLKTLLVPRSYRAVNNDALAALARACPSLVDLDISGCLKVTEVGIIQVATFCKGLQKLNVSGNFQFSNWALASVAMNCRGLRSLDMSGCLRVRDDGLEVLAAKCRGLISLDLGGCRDVTDHGVCEIAWKCTRLESIGLSACKNLTDVAVAAVAIGCKQLSTLNVSNVDSLTSKALLMLAEHAHQLMDLNAGGCFRITDQAILAVMRGCLKLNRISLRGCGRLTDLALTAVANQQPYYLDVRGCKGMSEGLILQVMQARNSQRRRLVSSYGL